MVVLRELCGVYAGFLVNVGVYAGFYVGFMQGRFLRSRGGAFFGRGNFH